MTRELVLLVDCGTSRVKGAVIDAKSLDTAAVVEMPAPAPRLGPLGECEVDPVAIASTVAKVLEGLCQKASRRPAQIYLCSEMHGFLLADAHNNPLTPYIGWRDSRASKPLHSGPSMLDVLTSRLASRYSAITGMRLRAGIPYVNVAFLHEQGSLPAGSSLLAMPDWIAASLGCWKRRMHVTMAASSGFLDLARRSWSEELLEAIGIKADDLRLPEVLLDEQIPIGEAEVAGRSLPIYGGAGDLQCAVLGAGVPGEADACLNVGTGSQVAGVSTTCEPRSAEVRPFFGGRSLRALTHIPAGRMLECFAAFFADVAQSEPGRSRFWSLLASLQVDEVRDAPLEVDPNIFPGSWRYAGGGRIGAIQEGLFNSRALVASIAKGWIAQYAAAISDLDPDHGWKTIAVAGGLPRRLPWFADAVRCLTGRSTIGPADGEDTLNGLAALARSGS